ncbi:MAG: BatA and WFA domain-containing protein [Planctomycetes bacterium]|nr:BatA and WFA domain-containing protein [Planctomycetota bacterium]
MSFLAPGALALLGFLPVVVLLYFLKLRREEVRISSTLLWRKSLEDLLANAPFQRLRRNLLLFLQLLILAAIVLAIARPSFVASRAPARATVLLIDRSGSMNARERDGTRLALAKDAALDRIRAMADGDLAAVVAFASKPEVLAGPTADRTELARAVGGIRTSSLSTDLGAALELARSLAAAREGMRILVIGDGAYEGLDTLPFETRTLDIEVISVGETGANAGIVSIEARRDPAGGGETEIYAEIHNAGPEPWAGLAVLRQEGRLLDSRRIEIGAGEGGGVLYRRPEGEAGLLEVAIDGGGALADDDRAWILVREPAPVRVAIVGAGNPWLETLLGATAFVEAVVVPPGAALPEPRPDVVIFDGEAPDAPPPDGATIYLGCAPSIWTGLERPGIVEAPVVVDWDREGPVTRFAAFGDLLIRKSLILPPAPGLRSILDAGAGSIAGTFAIRGARGAVIGFRLEDSNWPLTYSFPIFFLNAVRFFGGDLAGGAGLALRTGESLRFPAGGAASVIDPGGVAREIRGAGEAVFTATERAGVYRARGEGGAEQLFPINMADIDETRIAPAERVALGKRSVEVRSGLRPETREIWRWLAGLAFAVLVIEWYVYNKRVAI